MNIRKKDIIDCLPLLANALGNKYGIKIQIGGDEAMTDGKTIYLPSISPELDLEAMELVKGYLDHEAAHLRHTDFDILRHSQLDGLSRWIFNAIEDWRVENRLATIFPGCRRHFRRLIQKMFIEDKDEKSGNKKPVFSILNYILLTARSWDEPSLNPRRSEIRNFLDNNFSGLPDELDKLLNKVRGDCPDTARAIRYAKEIAACIQNWEKNGESQKRQAKDSANRREKAMDESDQSQSRGAKHKETCHKEEQNGLIAANDQGQEKEQNLADEINDSILKNDPDLPRNLGDVLKEGVNGLKAANQDADELVATERTMLAEYLPIEERRNGAAICNAMRSRLYGLLQTKTLRQSAIARKGRLHSSSLYRLIAGSDKIFLAESRHTGLSTAIHILLDCSVSMQGEPINLARKICYFVAKTLESIRGINPAVTLFPASSVGSTVYPLIRHGQRVSDRFAISAGGDTPLAPAIWWTLQNMLPLKEKRKIILILTDGVPNSVSATLKALNKCRQLGFEVYGIGIMCRAVEILLLGNSRIIYSLDDLAPAIFGLLQSTLCKDGLK